MKNIFDHIKSIFPAFLLATLTISLVLVSCNSNGVSNKNKLIPEKTFTLILSDVYIAGGLLTLPEIHSKFMKKDSIDTYIDIVKSYGYSYEAMNKTLKYYFIKKPKRLIRIYDNVLGKLSEMEALYENLPSETPESEINQWKGDPSYTYPDTAITDKPLLNQTLFPPTTFKLEITMILYPDDPSVNPHLTLWYCNADSAETGKRTYFPTIKYIKDGYAHSYTIKGTIIEKHHVILKGILFDFEDFASDSFKHARISDITFSILGAPL
jgi:hypothetical protein